MIVITVAHKPLVAEAVAVNVLADDGTGAIHIEAGRIGPHKNTTLSDRWR